jgi:hypothetical protein
MAAAVAGVAERGRIVVPLAPIDLAAAARTAAAAQEPPQPAPRSAAGGWSIGFAGRPALGDRAAVVARRANAAGAEPATRQARQDQGGKA